MKKTISLIFVTILTVALMVALLGCVPQNYERAVKKMEKAGYAVEPFNSIFEGANSGFSAVNKNGNYLTATLFNSKESANKAYQACLNVPKIYNLTLNGKWVYHGSEQAIEDFK